MNPTINAPVAQPQQEYKVSRFDNLILWMQSKSSKVVVIALVLNTTVAQLLFNSAGQIAPAAWALKMFLIISSVCSTIAFSLFELSVVYQLHDLRMLPQSIRSEINAAKLEKQNFFILLFASLVNLVSIFYFLYAVWLNSSQAGGKFPLDALPAPYNYIVIGLHALMYASVLYIAGIFGERPKSDGELIHQMARENQQMAVDALRMQQQAQIRFMHDHNLDLTAVAVMLGSPETALQLVQMFAALNGHVNPYEAAIMNLTAAGKPTAAIQQIMDKISQRKVSGESAIQSDLSITSLQDVPDDSERPTNLVVKADPNGATNTPVLQGLSLSKPKYRLVGRNPVSEPLLQAEMAELIGLSAGAFSGAITRAIRAGMQFEGQRDGQPANARNITIDQVFEMIDRRILSLPPNVMLSDNLADVA